MNRICKIFCVIFICSTSFVLQANKKEDNTFCYYDESDPDSCNRLSLYCSWGVSIASFGFFLTALTAADEISSPVRIGAIVLMASSGIPVAYFWNRLSAPICNRELEAEHNDCDDESMDLPDEIH